MAIKKEIGRYIFRKIQYLQFSDDRAMLARLRRGIGHEPGEKPELYGIILKDMPPHFWSEQRYRVTEAEWSCYIALTLFSWHQQGNDIKLHCVHTSDQHTSVGVAMRKLVYKSNDPSAEERMQNKLQVLITSKDMREFSYHLKGIITLLRNEHVCLNYCELAEDIYEFQFEEQKKQIGLKWGQDFYRENKEDE